MHLPAKIVQVVDEQSRIGQDDDNLEQVDFDGINNKNNAGVWKVYWSPSQNH